MKVNIIGSGIGIGDSLKAHVDEHLNKEVKKYFENAVDAEVHFSREGSHLIKTMIYVNEGVRGGINVKSSAQAGEPYGSFSEALQRAAKQLRRYKAKIKNYRRNGNGIKDVQPNYAFIEADKYVIPPSNLDIFSEMEQNEAPKSNDNHKNIEIIAEKTTEIETLSVEDAIMKMDLADLPALAFVNEENGKINVVYHRKDGNISWVNPKK